MSVATAPGAATEKTRAQREHAKHFGEPLILMGHNGAQVTWPLIATYVLGAPAVHWSYITEATYGSVWVVALMIVLSTLTKDFNRNATFILIILLVAIFFGLGWLGDTIGLPILGSIGDWFRNLDIPGPRDIGMLVALGCTLGIIWDRVRSRLNDYWSIGGNQIDHFVGGQYDTSFPRLNTTVTTRYPDMVRMVLLLSGDIVFRNPNEEGQRVIKNVPLCPFVSAKIRRKLDALAVYDQAVLSSRN